MAGDARSSQPRRNVHRRIALGALHSNELDRRSRCRSLSALGDRPRSIPSTRSIGVPQLQDDHAEQPAHVGTQDGLQAVHVALEVLMHAGIVAAPSDGEPTRVSALSDLAVRLGGASDR